MKLRSMPALILAWLLVVAFVLTFASLSLRRHAALGTNGDVDVDYAYGTSFVLANTEDEIFLYEGAVLIDGVARKDRKQLARELSTALADTYLLYGYGCAKAIHTVLLSK